MKTLLRLTLALLLFVSFWLVPLAEAQAVWRPAARPDSPASVSLYAAPSLALTITGTLDAPLVLHSIVPPRVAYVTASGTIPATAYAGPWIDTLENMSEYGACTGIAFNDLVGAMRIQVNEWYALETFAAPELRVVVQDLGMAAITALGTLSLPKLETIGGALLVSQADALTAISLPKLKRMGLAPNITGTPLLETLYLPMLEEIHGFVITGKDALANVTIGPLKRVGANNFQISGCALTAASVDGILTRLAALDGTAGTTAWGSGCQVHLSGGTSATPTFTGTTQTSTAIVGNGTTATVTKAAHGYTTGDLITISGAVNSAFNGTKQITVTDADTFTFPCAYTGTAGTQGSMKKAGSTTEGYYKKQVLELRGATVLVN